MDTARIEIPLSEVLPKLSGDADTSLLPIHKPPLAIGCYHHYRLNPDIKAIIVVPAFHSKTAEARSQLPHSYTREDVIFKYSALRFASRPTWPEAFTCGENLRGNARPASSTLSD